MNHDDMPHYNQHGPLSTSTSHALLNKLRLITAVLGIMLIIIGLVYAVKMFSAIYTTLQNPEDVQPLIDRWTVAIGASGLSFTIGENTYNITKPFVIIILGVGSVVLAHIAIGLVIAGAKVISWTTGEREAVKKILTHAFGKQKPPYVKKDK
ncbi:MAG: hypothetical protein ACYSXD_09035 [Planctomycetota bacterium]